MIHLNCDMGEIEETWNTDQEILAYISAVNISCGYHAGSPSLISRTIEKAMQHGVEIGIHPGFDDPDNFGRKAIAIDNQGLDNLLSVQIESFLKLSNEQNATIKHIKAHGALYHSIAYSKDLSETFSNFIKSYNWTVIGPPNSILEQVCLSRGLNFLREGFADRAYEPTGELVSRTKKNAVFHTISQAENQIKSLSLESKVYSINGAQISLAIDTICLHGDNPICLPLLKSLRSQGLI
ncbi:5-oxoprolinase subunit PxpA [Jiulongibacter sp. NS-SX5]|uniref:5-oxoprolinase subunit PxpA n=1 Tax=Jiulongibacter sp. NS-SX5 TaxID=3463854 RepID=UPI00405A24BD